MRFSSAGILASFGGLGLAVSVLASQPLAAKEPVVLSPSSQWNVDFGAEKCRLARIFGEGDDRHLLFIEQYAPSSKAGMTVAGPSFRRFENSRDTSLSFSQEEEARKTQPLVGQVDGVGRAVIYTNVKFFGEDGPGRFRISQLDTAFGAEIEFISLEQKGREVRLATGELGEAFKVLNTCTQDMIRDWGLDVDKHLTLTRKPEFINEEAITRRIASYYPGTALHRGQQAIFRLRAIIDEDGRVAQCTLDAATNNELRSKACREMESARFEPALDAEGQPFRSFYTTSITYQIGR